MKILAIISDATFPVINATRMRNHFIWPALKKLGADVKLLVAHHNINDLSPAGPPDVECEFFSLKDRIWWKRGWPAFVYSYHQYPHSDALFQRVLSISRSWQPDVIHAEELQTAHYLPLFMKNKLPAKQTVTLHNVETDLQKQSGTSPFKTGRDIINRVHQATLARYEATVVRHADLCLTYSDLDLKKYQEKYPFGRWQASSNGTNASGIIPREQVREPRLLIVGSLSYAPNINGLVWFLDHILPLLSSKYIITIAGSRATPSFKNKIRSYPVEFIDSPADLGALYHDCALSVVPLQEGSGTRTKILESLSYERIVVTTSIGAEGLDLDEKQGVLIADDPQGIACQIMRGISQYEERVQMGHAGREHVLKNFDWLKVASDLKNIWTHLCLGGTGHDPHPG
jgi:glycosyltransferase involved in cell wall biosynthesis